MILRSIILAPILIFAFVPFSHSMELKDITYSTKEVGKVVFSHKSHLGKKTRTTAGFSCKSCHKSVKLKMRNYTMAEMEKGKSCGACHNGSAAFTLAKCTRCHKVRDIVYKVKETGPVLFSHSGHLGKMECGSCHSRLFKAGPNPKVSMAEMGSGKSCGACHDGKAAFGLSECVKCHPMREVTFKVVDAGDVLFSHKFHIGMYSCGECHPRLYIPGKGNATVTMSGMEAQKSCGACHDGSSAFTVKENCDKCHKMD